MSAQMSPDDRALGLRFVVDVVNDVVTTVDWRRTTELHGDPSLADRRFVMSEFAAAVSELREVFSQTRMETAASVLNRMLADPSLATSLAQLPDGRWVLRPVIERNAGAAAVLRAIAAFALGRWAADHGRCAWGECAATGCERVFIDEGRRSPQRFCSEACATRTRVAAHRRRAAARNSAPGGN